LSKGQILALSLKRVADYPCDQDFYRPKNCWQVVFIIKLKKEFIILYSFCFLFLVKGRFGANKRQKI